MRARGRLDSHRQNGFFRGFGIRPFRGRVSSLQPPVTRAVRPNAGFFFFWERANGFLFKPGSAGHTRDLGFPTMSFFSGVVF